MGIEEDVKIDEQAEEFMSKPPEQRERLLYVAVLKTDRMITNLNINGCKRFCDTTTQSAFQRWTPATIGTVMMGIIYGAVEYLKSKS